MGLFNFGSSSSSSNVAELGFCGTIGENPDFDAEDSAKALHKAFHSKYTAMKNVNFEQLTVNTFFRAGWYQRRCNHRASDSNKQ